MAFRWCPGCGCRLYGDKVICEDCKKKGQEFFEKEKEKGK